MLTILAVCALALQAPELRADLVYRTVDGLELRLDAYVPPGAGPHPALLLVHGGAWMHGDKKDVRPVGERLAAKGYACFAPRYRLAPAARFPAQIDDCIAAVQWVRANAARFHVGPERIGALGFSAGGHLVALLGTMDERRDPAAVGAVARESSRVQCVVSFFGPVVLTRAPVYDFDTQAPPELFGDAPDAVYVSASPLELVTKDDAAFLLVHGDADELVAVDHSRLMDEKLRGAGVRCELVEIPGGGHGDFLFADPNGAYWQRSEAFLARELAAHADEDEPGKTR